MAYKDYRPALTERNKHCFFYCEHCGKDSFRRQSVADRKAGYKQRWCSTECMKASGAFRKPEYYFNCETCGKESNRRRSGTAKDKGYLNRYCSMDCRAKAGVRNRAERERVRKELAAIRTMGRRIRANDERRRKEGIKRIITVLTDRLHSMLPPLLCPDCGVSFNKERDGRKVRCDACIDLKERTRRREANRKRMKSPEGRAAKSAYKARRRARVNIDYESVDPIYILSRDKWICQLCGIRTPQAKRGSYADDAPEVDHIISLADGGSHTKANLQCACRSCNIKKGAKSMGQMRLG